MEVGVKLDIRSSLRVFAQRFMRTGCSTQQHILRNEVYKLNCVQRRQKVKDVLTLMAKYSEYL